MNNLTMYKDLKDNISKVEDISIQIDRKANSAEVIKKGEVTLNDCTSEMLTAIQGGEGTEFNLLTIPRDGSVSAVKTDFISVGKNKFNKSNIISEGHYIASNGTVSTNSQLSINGWIPLEIDKTYTISSPNNTFFYVAQFSEMTNNLVANSIPQGFISRVDTAALTPQNVYTFTATGNYLLVSYLNTIADINIQIEEGETNTDYEAYKEVLDERVEIPKLNEIIKSNNYGIFDLAYIKDGQLIMNNDHINSNKTVAKYTFADLGENAVRVMCKCKFYGNSTVALIAEPNGMTKVEDITNKSVHVTWNAGGGCTASVFDNKSTLFDITNNFTPCVTDGSVEYEMGFRLNGNVLTVFMPDGTSVDIERTEWGTAIGRYVCWEHYTSNIQSESDYRYVAFTEFYSFGATKTIRDNFRRLDGAIGISPTGHIYSQIRNV